MEPISSFSLLILSFIVMFSLVSTFMTRFEQSISFKPSIVSIQVGGTWIEKGPSEGFLDDHTPGETTSSFGRFGLSFEDGSIERTATKDRNY